MIINYEYFNWTYNKKVDIQLRDFISFEAIKLPREDFESKLSVKHRRFREYTFNE